MVGLDLCDLRAAAGYAMPTLNKMLAVKKRSY